MHLKALKLLYPKINLTAVGINPHAVKILAELIEPQKVFPGSILEFSTVEQFDLVLIKTVLIHINPEALNIIYEKMYQSASKYILICEYYNKTPVTISYRGHEDRLFKRDFAGEMLDIYSDLELIDYGFAYHRVPQTMYGDITWFLLKKH